MDARAAEGKGEGAALEAAVVVPEGESLGAGWKAAADEAVAAVALGRGSVGEVMAVEPEETEGREAGGTSPGNVGSVMVVGGQAVGTRAWVTKEMVEAVVVAMAVCQDVVMAAAAEEEKAAAAVVTLEEAGKVKVGVAMVASSGAARNLRNPRQAGKPPPKLPDPHPGTPRCACVAERCDDAIGQTTRRRGVGEGRGLESMSKWLCMGSLRRRLCVTSEMRRPCARQRRTRLDGGHAGQSPGCACNAPGRTKVEAQHADGSGGRWERGRRRG